jgi:hypothetical protein
VDWHNSHAVLCRLDSWYFTCIQHDPKSRNPLERQFSCRTTQNTNLLKLMVTLEYWTVDCALPGWPWEIWGTNTSFTRAERVLIIQHYSISKSYAECRRSFRQMRKVPPQCLCSQSDQQDKEDHVAPRYREIIGALLAILRHRVTGPHFFFRNGDCRLQQECATTHTHTRTQRIPPWQQWKNLSVTR